MSECEQDAARTRDLIHLSQYVAAPDRVVGRPRRGVIMPGFGDTFTSRYIETGDVRLHAVIGGDEVPPRHE